MDKKHPDKISQSQNQAPSHPMAKTKNTVTGKYIKYPEERKMIKYPEERKMIMVDRMLKLNET